MITHFCKLEVKSVGVTRTVKDPEVGGDYPDLRGFEVKIDRVLRNRGLGVGQHVTRRTEDVKCRQTLFSVGLSLI